MNKNVLVQISSSRLSDLFGQDVLFLLDNSNQLTTEEFEEMKEKVVQFINKLPIGSTDEDTMVIFPHFQYIAVLYTFMYGL